MDYVRIQYFEIELFRMVRKYFIVNITEYFTHVTLNARIFKVIIKGLLSNISETEIISKLKGKGYDMLIIRQFSNAEK